MKDSIQEAIAGAFAGATTKTLVAPLDRLKLVVQLRGSIITSPQAASASEASKAYEGPWKALSKIVQEEGFLALWRGNLPTVLIKGGTSALNFMFMALYKDSADRLVSNNHNLVDDGNNTNNRQRLLLTSLVSGGLAGGTAITLLYPIGLVRTKLALDVGKENRLYPNGMRDVIRHSLQVNGITSLFRGYGVALASVSMYRMVHLGGYDYLKTELCLRHNLPTTTSASQLPFAERFLAAQLVSMAASTVHYPLDTVRRRLMMQSDVTNGKYKNGFHCFTQIYKEEGMKGYFRGLGTNYIRSVGAALVLVSYDFFKTFLF